MRKFIGAAGITLFAAALLTAPLHAASLRKKVEIQKGEVGGLSGSGSELKGAVHFKHDNKKAMKKLKEKTGFTEMMMRYDLHYEGEGFFWSKKEKCYNAFFQAVDPGGELDKKLAESRRSVKVSEAVFRKKFKKYQRYDRSMTFEEYLEKMVIAGQERWLRDFYSPYTCRIALCPKGEDKYKVQILLNRMLVQAKDADYVVTRNESDDKVNIELDGWTVVLQPRAKKAYKVKGAISATLSKEVREPFDFDGVPIRPGEIKGWGHGTVNDEYTWRGKVLYIR